MPRPRLRIYTPESVVAEKLHAMVALGLRNSRLRDFFDVDALARRTEFDGEILASAIGATFARCQTEIPASAPTALTAAFYGSPEKQAQWRAFRNKVSGSDEGDSRQEVVERLALFLTLPLDACRAQGKFAAQWPAGGPWTL